MARVRLIQTKDDVAPEHYALVEELSALRGRVSGPSTIVLHSPGLARPWNEVSEYLHRESIVEPRFAELAVCATARARDCGYVWNAHAPNARKNGVSDATLDAVGHGQSTGGMPDDEALVVRYVNQLMHQHRVADDVFDALLAAHSPKWLAELTVWIARYAALGFLLNGFELTPENPAAPLPDLGKPAGSEPGQPAPPPRLTPRIPPVTAREQLEEADRPFFDKLGPSSNEAGARGILKYSPRLCGLVSDVADWLSETSEVEKGLGELAVLALARELDAAYTWAAHVRAARRAGVDEAAIATIRDRASLDALPPAERDVVDYAYQQLREHRVNQELFDRLHAQHGAGWLVELTCLMGHFGIISAVVNAFELAPAPGGEQLPLG